MKTSNPILHSPTNKHQDIIMQIHQQINKSLVQQITNKMLIQQQFANITYDEDDSQQKSNESIIMYVMQMYNNEHEKNEQQIRNLQEQYSNKIKIIEQAYVQQINEIKKTNEIQIQILQYSIQKLQKTKHQITKQNTQKNDKISLLFNKITNFQSLIQKLEFQLCQKQTHINSLQQDTEYAQQTIYQIIQQSERKNRQYLKQFQQVYQICITQKDNWLSQKQLFIKSNTQLTEIIQSFENNLQQNIKNVNASNQTDQDYEKKLQEKAQTKTDFISLKEVKETCSKLAKLITKQSQQTKQHQLHCQNLSHKYTKFLKQTQQKITSSKSKNKQLNQQIKILKQTQIKLNVELEQKQKSIINLMTQLKQVKQSQQAKSIQINKMEIEKQETDTNNKLKVQSFNTEIDTLKVEIQSLKQSISTLKNAVTLTPNSVKQTDVVQQMMDKTYQIRLQNSKMKNIITQQQSKLQSIQKQMIELSNENIKLKQTNDNKFLQNQLLILQKQNLLRKTQTNKLQQQSMQNQISLHLLQKQQLNKTINNLQQQSLSAQSEVSIINQQLKEQLKINQIVLSQCITNYEKLQNQNFQLKILKQMTKQIQSNNQLSNTNKKILMEDPSVPTTRNKTPNRRERRNTAGCLVTINANRNAKLNEGNIQKQDKIQEQLDFTYCSIKQKEKENMWIGTNEKSHQQSNFLQKDCQIQDKGKENNAHVEELNDIINYMFNYLKGYTRNGIRNFSWLTSQGHDYLLKVTNHNNLKTKYTNFEKVRSLTLKNYQCKQLVKDYQKIVTHYFQVIHHFSQQAQPQTKRNYSRGSII